jgi:hypothetical protein
MSKSISGRKLNQNIYSLISPYISYVDHIKFIKSFPFLKIKYPKTIILQHITKKLKKMGLEEKQISLIFNTMRNYNIVISGSFVLSILLGEYWEGSDIDFYRKSHENDEIDDDCQDFLFHRLFDIEGYERLLNENYDYLSLFKSTKYRINDLFIANYLSYRSYNNHRLWSKDIKDYIHYLFDFDFCKNIIDLNSKEIIFIYDIDSLINKSCNFNISKYVSRNYNEHLVNMSKNMYDKTMYLIEKRKKKYRERGFKINQCR